MRLISEMNENLEHSKDQCKKLMLRCGTNKEIDYILLNLDCKNCRLMFHDDFKAGNQYKMNLNTKSINGDKSI
jgi:hypothetical protein